jgi:hypothetical protein
VQRDPNLRPDAAADSLHQQVYATAFAKFPIKSIYTAFSGRVKQCLQEHTRRVNIFYLYLSMIFIAFYGISFVLGDVYMHNPRGSNNKLFEQSNTVTNNQRLYDSENNNNGGYQVGDKCIPNCLDGNNQYQRNTPGSGEGIMEYYEGSELWIEWTSQHGSQSEFLDNQIVIQYMCNDGEYSNNIRDGRTTNTIPLNANDPNINDFGQHENHKWYQECSVRERNKGLFTADQNMNGRDTAIHTRQNAAGTRSGLECPEERDYYPYWHPSPWRDVWVCTNKPARCAFYQAQSQNVINKGKCSLPQYNNGKDCEFFKGVWTESGSWNTVPPECTICPKSRLK